MKQCIEGGGRLLWGAAAETMVVKIGRDPSLSLIQSAKFQLILLNNY